MLKLYTAFTKQLDDPALAVREITEQLKYEEHRLKNTVGITYFHCEFANTGIYQAIADSLPFEVVGCVTSHIGASGLYGDYGLSVVMLTADDVNFSIRTLESVDTKSREQLFEDVTELLTGLCAKEKPKIVMPLVTPQKHFSGDDLVTVANSLPDPFPLFGAVAFNDDNWRENNFVAKGNVTSETMFAFIALYGDIQPKFHLISSFIFQDNLGDYAKITDAEGPILKTVNDIPALEYLQKQSVINIAMTNARIWVIPAVLTYPNGTKVARAFLGTIEGTEYIYSAGNLEVGAKISFADLDGEKTVASAEKLFTEINAASEDNIIAYSCAARAWSLGTQYLVEVKKISECIKTNYSMSYSAGEICPILDENGKLINVFHNYTLTSCSFN